MMFRPAPAHYVRLPDSFGRRVLVTVDTEEEFDWSAPKRRDAVSVTSMSALPEAHRLLRGFGVVPTYMVDFPVVSDAASVDILRPWHAAGECVVGAQLHPWVNPPFAEPLDERHSFPGNLSRETERAKIAALTAAMRTEFGTQPNVFRAGRYGIGPNTEALLYEAGYRVDSSVRPYFDYRPQGGPDFRRIRPAPYWSGRERLLLELPLSVTFSGPLRRLGEPLYRGLPTLRGALARSGLLSRVALTPEGIPLDEAVRALDALLGDGLRLVCISFHSPSLVPGHTPYVRDAADLRRLYAWLDGVLAYLARAGVTPVTPDEVLAAALTVR
jgi:hypothetical protein